MASYTLDGDYLGGNFFKKIKGIVKKAAFVSALPVLGLAAIPATVAYKMIKKKRAAAAAAASAASQASGGIQSPVYSSPSAPEIPMNPSMSNIGFPAPSPVEMPESAPITTDPYGRQDPVPTEPKKSSLPLILAAVGVGAAFLYFKSKKGGAA
jgi:hypothetical protein